MSRNEARDDVSCLEAAFSVCSLCRSVASVRIDAKVQAREALEAMLSCGDPRGLLSEALRLLLANSEARSSRKPIRWDALGTLPRRRGCLLQR